MESLILTLIKVRLNCIMFYIGYVRKCKTPKSPKADLEKCNLVGPFPHINDCLVYFAMQKISHNFMMPAMALYLSQGILISRKSDRK